MSCDHDLDACTDYTNEIRFAQRTQGISFCLITRTRERATSFENAIRRGVCVLNSDHAGEHMFSDASPDEILRQRVARLRAQYQPKTPCPFDSESPSAKSAIARPYLHGTLLAPITLKGDDNHG